MRFLGLIAAAATALITAGCATRIVSSHVELGADFAKYRTYDWAAADALPTGDPRLDNNEFFRDDFQGAVDKALAARRFTITSNDPDLLIHLHTSVTRRLDVDAFVWESPACHGAGCRPAISERELGTLMIDVHDARSKKLVWRAWSQDNFSGLIDDQARMRQAIVEAVGEMMSRFPKTVS